MNNDHNNPNADLHLNLDPELAQTESLLDQLAQQDRNAMPDGLESRMLDAISQTLAPQAIAFPQPVDDQRVSKWRPMRYAAAAILATGVTLTIVANQPWEIQANPGNATIALVSLEQDLDAFFELETMDTGNLSEAVTEWEIWAQAVDAELNTSIETDGIAEEDWFDSYSESGAL